MLTPVDGMVATAARSGAAIVSVADAVETSWGRVT
jgi:hypothetical protein